MNSLYKVDASLFGTHVTGGVPYIMASVVVV